MAIDCAIQTFQSVSSTQDILRELAERGAAEGVCIHALEQTAGRGRHGREWVAGEGNLFLSVLLRPGCPAREIGRLSIVTGLALVETMAPLLHEPGSLKLKWPNDVFIDGKKCAGILIESALKGGNVDYAVVGVGVNIAAGPLPETTFIEAHGVKVMGLEAFRDLFLQKFGHTYSEWQKGNFAEIREGWLRHAQEKGSKLLVKVGDKAEEGLFDGIDEDGNLLLLLPDGRHKVIVAGEVYPL